MTLQKRITLFFIFSIIVVVAVQLTTTLKLRQVADQRFASAVISAKEVLWQKALSTNWERMSSNATALTRNRDVTKGLKKNNVKLLSEAAMTSYNRLSTSGIISRLKVTDKAGIIKKAFPQDSALTEGVSELAIAAITEGIVKKDLVMDSDGSLWSSVVFPLYSRGKAVGAGIYELELEAIVTDFIANDESNVFILIGNTLVHTTNEDLANAYFKDEVVSESKFQTAATIGNKIYSITGVPLTNSKDENLAVLISLKDRTESFSDESRITTTASLASAFLIILVVMGGYFYLGHLFKPLQKSATDMDSAANNNDLSCRMNNTGNDETGLIAKSFNQFVSRIQGLVNQVLRSTQTLSIASNAVADIARVTNEGALKQDSETQALAAAITQMAASAEDVTRNAKEAANTADLANTNSIEGRGEVENTIERIGKLAQEVETIAKVVTQLNSRSSEIGSVVDSIGDIAEQTNLLALNAAIEAARAGEQGRGFAVVADEVRTLASRTQQSTQDIKDMIERLQGESQKAVAAIDTGNEYAQLSVEQANRAGESIEKITASISQITEMNAFIANVSESQHLTSQEIHANINEINTISKETATNSQILVESSKNMAKEVHNVRDLVAQFKT
ncbi:MAG: methyl-accepting chemotaxis protein [Pseudomonadales bacterium]|nr:methyl-accepting chemotaxis protein [Pseudomonadales bacterium]